MPPSYDTLAPTLDLAIVNTFDVQIFLDVGEADDILAGVPQARRAARAKAREPVTQAFFQRNELRVLWREYVVFFPRWLAWFRPLEPFLGWCPLGAQYVVVTSRSI